MSAPEPTHGKERQAQSRRADEAVTRGIEDAINACHSLSAKRRLAEISFFVALYTIGAFVCLKAPQGYSLNLLGILPMAAAINSLGILIHEGLHGLLAKNRSLNHLFSFFIGLPLLISARAYRVTHNDHHIEFGRKLDYGTYRQHLDNHCFVWGAYYAQLFFGSILYVIFIPILGLRSARPRQKLWILVEYVLIGIIVATFVHLVPGDVARLLWLYPALLAMVFTNIRGLASHALGEPDDIYLSSRTIRSSRLVELLFLNENYHLEHHLFPQVPSYHLKKVHSLVWDRLPKALYASSYLSFLIDFFRASITLNLACCGLVFPEKEKLQK